MTIGRFPLSRSIAGRALTASGLLGCILSSAAPAPAQFSVSPVIVSVPRAAPGSSSSGILAVRNEGDRTMNFRMYVADFQQTVGGAHSVSALGEAPGSCGAEVRVTPEAMSIQAGETGQVRFDVPGGPSGASCWSMVFVESPTATEAGVTINQRIGVKLFGVGPDTAPGGEIEAASVGEEEGTRVVSLDYHNPGNAPARPSGSLEIRDYRGTRIASTAVRPFTVLPDSKRRIVVEIPAELGPGRYLAIPMLDFGGEHLAGTQIPFSVP